jgi:hypothetical protein
MHVRFWHFEAPAADVTTVVEPPVVRGYSHRAREIATDMAADVLSLVAAETILSFGGKIACALRKQHRGR